MEDESSNNVERAFNSLRPRNIYDATSLRAFQCFAMKI